MGDAKRRQHLGIKPDLKGGRKKHVMNRAKSEPLRPGFLRDLGRDLASNGQESIHCKIPAVNGCYYSALPGDIGIAMQIEPALISYSPPPSHIYFGPHMLTVECLSKESPKTLFEYAMQQLTNGVTLRVGYDRAYQGSSEYVVPLILEYK